MNTSTSAYRGFLATIGTFSLLLGCNITQAQNAGQLEPNSKVGIAATAEMRVYAIGNSVTDTLKYKSFAGLLQTSGYKPVVARHMIPGAPLDWLLSHPTQGFKEEPYGYPTNAFANYQWDAITLQPFDRRMDSDTQVISEYISMARKNPQNDKTRFFIYARWPRMSKDGRAVKYNKDDYGKESAGPDKITDYKQVDKWESRWNAKYNGGWANNETADYFATLTQKLREKEPDVVINMIPVGHVMAALNNRMEEGEIAGYTSIYDVYTDSIHLNTVGSYIVGITYYATITGKSPVGLPFDLYGLQDENLARAIQQTAWEIVKTQPLSGVKE
jgi:hypothetical protein